MAKFTLRDARIEVNGSVLSDHANEVSVETQFDEQDFTAFGANNKEIGKGLGDATINVTFFQDMVAGSIDSILWPLSISTTPFTVKVRATTSAISTSNPEYSMSANMFGYNPISGAVGNPASTPVTFRNASQAGLARATS